MLVLLNILDEWIVSSVCEIRICSISLRADERAAGGKTAVER